MKTVITSSGDSLDSEFDLRFGRAAWFCIYDEESGECSFVENKNMDDSKAAGVKVSEKMSELGIGKIISGDFGPKVKDLLNSQGIQMVILQNEGSKIKDIVNK